MKFFLLPLHEAGYLVSFNDYVNLASTDTCDEARDGPGLSFIDSDHFRLKSRGTSHFVSG